MKTKIKLNFEYCECGCHGYAADAESFSYSIYWDLRENFYTHRGHGLTGYRIGTYNSYNVAKEACNQDAERRLNDLHKALGIK